MLLLCWIYLLIYFTYKITNMPARLLLLTLNGVCTNNFNYTKIYASASAFARHRRVHTAIIPRRVLVDDSHKLLRWNVCERERAKKDEMLKKRMWFLWFFVQLWNDGWDFGPESCRFDGKIESIAHFFLRLQIHFFIIIKIGHKKTSTRIYNVIIKCALSKASSRCVLNFYFHFFLSSLVKESVLSFNWCFRFGAH